VPADPLYDTIGATYTATRREDRRVAAQIGAALGPGRSMVNVGAGTGSYEPADRFVVAVEPSPTMIDQRAGRSPHVIRGVAECLPFADGAFDAALAVFTVHHWSERAAGLAELRRVAHRQVVLIFEPLEAHRFWALEYFEEARELPTERNAPSEALLRWHLNVSEVQTVMVPADCDDGFGAAFWARPERYLDPDVQAGMSWIALLAEPVRARATKQLAADLVSGEWDRRFGHLRTEAAWDAGYRLIIAHD
jgi:ubiquinone/menaquinone biosynthesis C-methylase UbiE